MVITWSCITMVPAVMLSESVQCLIVNRYKTGLASRLNNCLGSQISAFFSSSSFKSHSHMEYSTQLAVV